MKRIARFLSLALLAFLIALPVNATVSSETTRVKYTCDGTTTVYAYPFKIYETDDILAVKALTSTGAETTLVFNTDYTVSGAGGAGGNVTLTAGSVCGSGYTLTILRNIELTQETDYVDGQAFSAESLENAIDKVTLIQQQQEEKIGRAPKLPKTSSITDIALPNPSANNYIGWNAGATNLENKAGPVATTATQYEIDALVSYGGGTAYTQATIAAALTAIGTTNKVTLLLRPGTWVVSSNADWSAYTNVTFKIVPGALLQIATGTTTTIAKMDDSGVHQRFSLVGTGAIRFTTGAVREVIPQWFGALGDNSNNDGPAIQAAINSLTGVSGTVFLPTGRYVAEAQITAINDITIKGAGVWNNVGATIGSAIIGKHTGHAVLSFAGSSFGRLENLYLAGHVSTTPKTVLLFARTSAASAGWHVIRNNIIGGYSTYATIASIASEQNSFYDNFIQTDGGGALYTYWTGQSDQMGTGYTGSSNTVTTFINNHIAFAAADAGSSAVYIMGGGSTGKFNFLGGFFVAGNGYYLTIETGQTDGLDQHGGPLVFQNVGGEASAGRTPLGGVKLTSASSKAIYDLTIDNCDWSGGTYAIYTDTSLMQLYNANIRMSPTKPSVLPAVFRSTIVLPGQKTSIYQSHGNILQLDRLKTYYVTANHSSNLFIDTGITHPPMLDGYQYSASSPIINMFGKQRIAWHTAAPTIDTVSLGVNTNSWRKGDIIYNSTAASGQPIGWQCVTSGTFSTATTVVSINNGESIAQFGNQTQLDYFSVGDYVTIVGVTGIFEVLSKNVTAGYSMQLDGNANATVSGAVIETPNPTFLAMPNLP